jgi:hypothetical protein
MRVAGEDGLTRRRPTPWQSRMTPKAPVVRQRRRAPAAESVGHGPSDWARSRVECNATFRGSGRRHAAFDTRSRPMEAGTPRRAAGLRLSRSWQSDSWQVCAVKALLRGAGVGGSPVRGDPARLDDRRRGSGPAPAADAPELPAATAARLSRGACADRRLRACLVRDRGPACTLLVYVDSRLMELACAEVESTFDYFRATRRYLERYGKPMAFPSAGGPRCSISGARVRRAALPSLAPG